MKRLVIYILSVIGIKFNIKPLQNRQLVSTEPMYDTRVINGLYPPDYKIPRSSKMLNKALVSKWNDAINVEKLKKKELEKLCLDICNSVVGEVFTKSLATLEERIKESVSGGYERVRFIDPTLCDNVRHSDSIRALRSTIVNKIHEELGEVDASSIDIEAIYKAFNKQFANTGLVGYRDFNENLYVLLSDVRAVCEDEESREEELRNSPYRD